MPKTLRKGILIFLCPLLFLLSPVTKAQEPTASQHLILFLQHLETEFDVKFSYVDEDLRSVTIKTPDKSDLALILEDIASQTQIDIQKLNDRYYTLAKSETIDICGQVLDNFEQNTVTGATVEILQSQSGTITDIEGKFSLTNVPRKAVLQIRYVGYKSLFLTAEDLVSLECPILLLDINYQQLNEVIVYKFLTTGISKQSDASITMNTKEFGLLPGLIEPDILKSVQALPGIKSIDETVSEINIRGGTNDQNLILWEGIKMYQSGHFFGLISAFNPHLTDEVMLVKNGTSAQYGEGVSGIISMRTKNNITTNFTGGAGFNLIGGDMYGQVPVSDKLAVQFSARRSLTDFFNTPTYDRFFERVFEDSEVTPNSNFYFYDFTGKVLYDINERQKVRLSFININNLLDYSERNMDTDQETHSDLDQTNLSFGGSLESDWGEKFSTSLNIYYTNYTLNALNSTTNNQQELFQNNEVEEASIKLNTHYQWNETIRWLNGYQFTETGIVNKTNVTQPPFKSDVKGILRTHALFSELAYVSNDKNLFARAGVRLNYLENVETFSELIIEPRLNINYTFAPHFKVEVLGEFKSQGINQVIDLEQHFLGIEKRRWVVSDNEDLPISKSKQGSVGINYDHENVYLGIEGFYKQVNGISTATQGFQNQNQFDGELGKYDVKGLEFLINRRAENYSTWLSYTYNLNNYTFDSLVPRTFPNNLDVRHNFTLAGTYTLSGLKVGVGLNYRTGRPFTEPNTDDPIDTTFFPYRIIYEDPNSGRLPEYIRADMSATYNFNINEKIKASVGASVLNVTNRKNTLNMYYRLNEDDEIETVKSVSLGLTPNLSFRAAF